MGLLREYVSTTTEPKNSSYFVRPFLKLKKNITIGMNRLTVALKMDRKSNLCVCVCVCICVCEGERVYHVQTYTHSHLHAATAVSY